LIARWSSTAICHTLVLLPQFHSPGYTYDTASSSIAAAVISRIPVLTTEQVAWRYTYLPSCRHTASR
jgi:hypothetical protein